MAKINIKIDADELAETKAQLAELLMLMAQIEASLVRIKKMLNLEER